MPSHVALLRGINVGSHNRVPMPALRDLVTELGHADVATYIASGNVVFTAVGGTRPADSPSRSGQDEGPGLLPPPAASAALAAELEEAIAAQLDVSCRVVVLTCADLQRVVADNPYPDQSDHKRLHAFFLTGEAGAAAQEHLEQVQRRLGDRLGNDAACIVGRTLYLHTPDGFGHSELGKALSKPRGPVEATARNWATVTKLAAMCREALDEA